MLKLKLLADEYWWVPAGIMAAGLLLFALPAVSCSGSFGRSDKLEPRANEQDDQYVTCYSGGEVIFEDFIYGPKSNPFEGYFSTGAGDEIRISRGTSCVVTDIDYEP